MFDYATAMAHWAEWARQHVNEWPGTGPEAAPTGAEVQRENARLSGLPPSRPEPAGYPASVPNGQTNK